MTTFKPIASKLKEILTPETWCQGHFAINAEGKAVRFNNPSACKFCLVGAMEKATNTSFSMQPLIYTALMRQAVKRISDHNVAISVFNDLIINFDGIKEVLDVYEELEKKEIELLAGTTDGPITDLP